MTDLSNAIFDLWTLAETKVWPEGAPPVKPDSWFPSIDGGWCHSGCGYNGADPLVYEHLDAALWRCVQLVAWASRYTTLLPSGCDGCDFCRGCGNAMIDNDPWDRAEPAQWIRTARMIVESFPDKDKP